ncbi:hypothetical protein GCM10007973_10240 [Polymorphobacter multimanifer]|nr:hypothetical protein GCM10007973_10240 [Polymorphobacter multimanifer]
MGGAVAAFAAKAVGTRIVLTLPMLALCAVLATSSWFLGAPWAIVVMLTAVMFAMASLVKPSANPFTARVWTAAGDISYSVILSHPFVIGMVSKVFVVLSAERLVPVWVLLPASIIAAFVVGALVYRLVERPMAEHIRRQLDRLFDRTNRPVIRPAI